MKKILMLGGSAQQVPAIKKAREMGYETVLVDYLPDNPGQFAADRWYQESTTDVEAVSGIAKDEGVSGILAYASDPAALPAAIVAERLGLPTNPANSVEILGVKHKFRKFLQDNGFPCPRTFTFSPGTPIGEVLDGLRGLKFPIVVKPTDSSGSKGVSFLESTDGIEGAIIHAGEYSRNKIIIAEEFIQRGFPHVIGGDIFVENGVITLYGDMAALREDGGKSLIPVGEKMPNGLNEKQRDALKQELQKVIDALDIRNGELNIELLIDKDDIPHFLELGPRAGGNMIPIQLSDAFGVDLIRANILAAMGEPVNLDPIEPKGCYMTYVLHSHSDGVFSGVEFSEEIEQYVYRKVIYKNAGDRVETFDGAGKALGIIFMRFPDVETMGSMQQRLHELIRIMLQ